MGGADRGCEQRDGGVTVERSSTGKRNLVIGVLCALLCAAVWIIESDAYRAFMPEDSRKITVGVFSDSYCEVQNGYS